MEELSTLRSLVGEQQFEELLVQAVVQQSANAKSRENIHPMIKAGAHGDVDTVRSCLQEGADVDLTCEEISGGSCLHLAAHNGHEAVVALLIEHSANVHLRDNDGDTPLHCASLNGHEGVAGLLLDAGTDVNAANNLGLTPLLLAADKGRETCGRRLLSAGANTDDRDVDGNCALHLACRRIEYQGIALVLAAAMADVDVTNTSGWTSLHFACRIGCVSVVQALLARGADPSARKNDLWTPLHLACDNAASTSNANAGFTATVEALVAAGADVCARNQSGDTPRTLAPPPLKEILDLASKSTTNKAPTDSYDAQSQSATACFLCKGRFSLFVRRRLCQWCSRHFCSSCSCDAGMAGLRSPKGARVCKQCLPRLQEQQEKLAPLDPNKVRIPYTALSEKSKQLRMRCVQTGAGYKELTEKIRSMLPTDYTASECREVSR